jgi:hypothetical protein
MSKIEKEEVIMLQIQDTLISLDIIEKKFVCDISQCRGKCCVLGDAGAPLLKSEVKIIKKNLKAILKFMNASGKEVVSKQGISMLDDSNELVTTLVDNKECAFVIFEDGVAKCAIEKAWEQGDIDFRKPVSCHLYPIRIKKFNAYHAVNYDKWQICDQALISGEKLGVPLYIFLKEALLRRFGKAWYDELLLAVEALDKDHNN